MSEAPAPVEGPLTVDQAVASLLTPAEPQQEAPEAPVEAAEEPNEPQGEDQTPEEAQAEPAEPAEGEETQDPEPAVEPLEAPTYWSKDAKARFADLTPELQAVVLSQEGPREEAAAKAKAEAAKVREAADSELAGVGKLAEALAERLPRWISAFENRWGTTNPDWVAYAQEHGVEAMTLAKTQFEAERQQLVEADQARQAAEATARETYVRAEFAKLAELAPELTNPETGLAKRQEVKAYCLSQGVSEADFHNISAAEMNMARKAMLWDRTQAALKAAPKPKPAPPPAKAPARPAATGVAPNPTKQATGRFHAAPTVENAIALLLAPKG